MLKYEMITNLCRYNSCKLDQDTLTVVEKTMKFLDVTIEVE